MKPHLYLRATLLAVCLLAGSVVVAPAAGAATIVVNSIADPGAGVCDVSECTLREAIEAANASTDEDDIIQFNISGTGQHTVAVTGSQLPTITDPVTIDGFSDPDDAGRIELDGTALTAAQGLVFGTGSSGSIVKGLVINDFGEGLFLVDPNITVQGNYIGTNPAGSTADANGTGIRVANANCLIGGTSAGAGNLISGNTAAGLHLQGNSHQVQGNLIGVAADGLTDLGNGTAGVLITGSSNIIGGTGSSSRNVISGNGTQGVEVSSATADTNTIKGNYIGLGSDGTTDVGNTSNGILLTAPFQQNATGNSIGGTAAGEGNVISGNGADGIHFGGAGVENTVIQQNILGLAADGSTDRGNDGDGVEADFAVGTTTVGGTTAAARNVVSGNAGTGLLLRQSSGTYLVQGNYIGMDAAGTTAVPNGGGGVLVQGTNSTIGGTTGVTVGGNCTGACNLISGNTGSGIHAGGGNLIQGNYIGTDVTGLLDRGNTGAGISSGTDSSVTTIGGTVAAERNIISGNNSAGFNWSDVGASNDVIQGNYIGVGTDGQTPIGNGTNGMFLGGDGNIIGGTAAGAGNVIASNLAHGIVVITGALNNSIRGNSIHSNTGLGIDLDPPNAVNANDAQDGDTGANNRQNYPGLSSATTSGAVAVQGTLNSAPSTAFALDFYSSPQCNDTSPNDFGEGKTYLGNLPAVATDGNGDASFSFTSSGTPPLAGGDVITATATDQNGNTSEFSQCLIALPAIDIQNASLTEGDAGTTTLSFTVSLSAPSTQTVTATWETQDQTATSPEDYEVSSGTVTFDPDETSVTIDVTLNGDTGVEPNETFLVALSDPVNAVIDDGQAVGTITNDDPACPGFAEDPRPQLVGTSGPNTIVGTPAAEILCGLGGNDQVRGAGGKDLVLGGSGKDRLRGQTGNDLIKGQAGNDRMSGGPGRDRCVGGPGKDSATGCEKGRA
jgi:CSLREA domain-containing protein